MPDPKSGIKSKSMVMIPHTWIINQMMPRWKVNTMNSRITAREKTIPAFWADGKESHIRNEYENTGDSWNRRSTKKNCL
jgi:hypothetical protein